MLNVHVQGFKVNLEHPEMSHQNPDKCINVLNIQLNEKVVKRTRECRTHNPLGGTMKPPIHCLSSRSLNCGQLGEPARRAPSPNMWKRCLNER